MTRIVLANLASPGNPGDFAIVLGSLKLLREYYGNPQVTLVTRHFSEAQAYRGLNCEVVPSYPNVEHMATDSRLKKMLTLPRTLLARNEMAEAIRVSDIVFLVGGGYFYSYRRLGPGLNYLSYCLPAFFAKRYGKPVVLLPQSYGPLNSGTAKWLLGKTLARAGAVFSRESISLKWLQEEYPDYRSRYQLMPDLGLFLEPSDLSAGAGTESASNTVGVTVRPWQDASGAENKYADILVEALAGLHRQTGTKIAVIVQVVRPTRVESDKEISLQVAGRLAERIGSENVRVELREPYFSVQDLCRLYQSCDFLIAMRLHSAILSFVMGRPALVTGYQHKSEGILDALGLDSLYVNSYENITREDLEKACLRLKQNLEPQRKKVEEALRRARTQIREVFTGTMRRLGL